jgi:hypothetical protein
MYASLARSLAGLESIVSTGRRIVCRSVLLLRSFVDTGRYDPLQLDSTPSYPPLGVISSGIDRMLLKMRQIAMQQILLHVDREVPQCGKCLRSQRGQLLAAEEMLCRINSDKE